MISCRIRMRSFGRRTPRPQDYRNAVDRAGAGVDLRVVIAILALLGVVALFLINVRP